MTAPDPNAPFVPFAQPDIGEEEIAAVVAAMRSGWLTTGPNAAAFEEEFARALGEGVQAVAVNSATAALHLALEAAGVGPGDEVLVPTWTFTSTAEVVRYLGAQPVLVDVHPDTLNIDLAAAESAVTPRTRGILPVHFGGLPVGPRDLAAFAQGHGLFVVEDAAHAFPAAGDGQRVGAGSSLATCFSFYATKTMTTGEGGMLVTRDDAVARRARTMRLHGISRDVFDRYRTRGASWEYEVVAPGFKYNLTDPAAAMGRVQLRRAQAMRDRRAQLAAAYDAAFAGLPVTLPSHAAGRDEHAWHLYVLRPTPQAPIGRDELVARLAGEFGIGASVHFIPLHRHPYWRESCGVREGDFPVAQEQFGRACSLPLSSALTDAQQQRVIEAVTELLT